MSAYLRADEVLTPWGKMEQVRARRLRPGPSQTRREVSRNQRERLFAATVASVATKGYPATTVADLISLAGVSRSTFYEHFQDKADCFRTTLKALLGPGLNAIRARLDGEGNPRERGERALQSLMKLVVSQPTAARVSLVEAYAAGPAGMKPIGEAFEHACELAHEALRLLPNRGQTPEHLSRAVVGGIHHTVYVHLYREETDALLDSCGELWRWAAGYEPPGELPVPRRPRLPAHSDPPRLGRDLHERILRGFAGAVAANGFSEVTVPQVAALTGISNSTFYQRFEDKADALHAVLDLSGAQLLAAVLPAARREAAWPQAIRRSIESLCRFLVSEPAFARLRTVEVYAAGPEAVEHRDRAWEEIVEELIPRDVREGPEPGPLSLRASAGAMYTLLYESVRKGELDRILEMVPLLTYIMVAPLLGGEAAWEVAAGRTAQPLPA